MVFVNIGIGKYFLELDDCKPNVRNGTTHKESMSYATDYSKLTSTFWHSINILISIRKTLRSY